MRYNDLVINDWKGYFDNKVERSTLEYYLLNASYGAIDSAYHNFKGELAVLPKDAPQLKSLRLNKKKVHSFFDYLLLAKAAERFAATDVTYSWEAQPKIAVPAALESPLLQHFKKSSDPFIKQRLWFQLVRYYYFTERNDSTMQSTDSRTLKMFNIGKNAFPQNLMYYRTLGYVAGWYYKNKDYAMSNYLNSLCYHYSWEAKIPSEWSFHPQEEADWIKTLSLAKNTEERVTLWHLLGIHYDPQRAINQIIVLDPKSEQLDLLLARVVNLTEYNNYGYENRELDSANRVNLRKNTELLSTIALKNNTSKPYFWNLAAGYLNFISRNYKEARTFYKAAEQQLPKNDKLVMAQYKILDWTLYVKELKKIDTTAELKMIEPLNWFANLKDQKDTIPYLRFYKALNQSISDISELYKKQGELVKANVFKSYSEFYLDNVKIEKMKTFLLKPNKTPFELAILRYYPFDMHDMYYHQMQMLTYSDKIDEAIAMMNKSNSGGSLMPANPFNIRLNDCHDCDHALKQPKDLYAIDVLIAMQKMKTEIKAGKNVYNNAYLLANAFYNLTFYGNARVFYQTKIMQAEGNTPFELPEAFRPMLLSNKIAEKYYLMAAAATKNKEQKARSIFMASKCERNESYTSVYINPGKDNANYWNTDINEVFFGKHFAALKAEYEETRFYQEALKECGYFKSYNDKY